MVKVRRGQAEKELREMLGFYCGHSIDIEKVMAAVERVIEERKEEGEE